MKSTKKQTFSFDCKVFDPTLIADAAEIHFENPVPVYSGEQRTGFAVLYVNDENEVFAECHILTQSPERLDIENQVAIWLLPHVIVQRRAPYDGTKPSKVTIKRLEFHYDVEDLYMSKVWE